MDLARAVCAAVVARVRTVGASMLDEWRHLYRAPSILLVLLAIPIVYPLLLSYLYAADQAVERPAVLCDDDNTALSRRLALDLDATQGLAIRERVPSVEQGWERLRRRQAEVLVYIPPGFSGSIKGGEQAELLVWIDTANILTYGVAYPAIYEAVGASNVRLTTSTLERRGVAPARAETRAQPVSLSLRPLYHPSGSYGDFFVPGVLAVVLQQVLLIGFGFSRGARRERGEPLPARFPFAVEEGRLLAQLGFTLGAVLFVVCVVHPAFGWSLRSPGALIVLFTAFVLALAPLAMVIGQLVPDRLAALQLLMFLSAPLLMSSGFAWPTHLMPRYLQLLAALFPSTPTLQALRVLTVKSGRLADVLPQLTWLAAVGAGWLVAAVALVRLRWRVRRWRQRNESLGRRLAGHAAAGYTGTGLPRL